MPILLLRIFWPSFWTWFAELDSDHAQFAIAALTAAVIGACVGSPQAQWLFQPMLEPNIDWMWVEPDDRTRDIVTAPRAVVVGLVLHARGGGEEFRDGPSAVGP